MRSWIMALFLLPAVSVVDAQEFSQMSFDFGVVVSDIDAAMKFYTEAIGLKEVPGFSVPGDWTAKAGLTDGKKLDIKMLALGDGPGAKLKLMQVEGVEVAKSKNDFLHSTLGFSYLTLHVKSMDAAVARLKKANVATVKQTPIPLPPPMPQNILITVARDPDGNFVELVGPK